MAQITFPIVADELRVDVRVNRSALDLIAIRAAGQPAPIAIPAQAQIDTGSNITGVSSTILQQLGAVPVTHSTTQGIGGGVSVLLFRVSLSILDAANPQLPWLVQPDLLVMELPVGTPVDVLIGMDVLRSCRMLVDGPARNFTLDF
jgi:hypothetical protein